MPALDVVKRWIGCEVDVDALDGSHHRGRLVNVTRRSLWILAGEEDHFILLAHVTDLHPAA